MSHLKPRATNSVDTSHQKAFVRHWATNQMTSYWSSIDLSPPLSKAIMVHSKTTKEDGMEVCFLQRWVLLLSQTQWWSEIGLETTWAMSWRGLHIRISHWSYSWDYGVVWHNVWQPEPVVCISSTLTAQCYIELVVEPAVRTFLQSVPGFPSFQGFSFLVLQFQCWGMCLAVVLN